jgi:hypothetical protein
MARSVRSCCRTVLFLRLHNLRQSNSAFGMGIELTVKMCAPSAYQSGMQRAVRRARKGCVSFTRLGEGKLDRRFPQGSNHCGLRME